jgi:hypothetical protein
MEGVESVFVDTTGRMVLKAKKDVKVSEKSLNDALASLPGISARKLERMSSKPPAAVYEVKMDGFS